MLFLKKYFRLDIKELLTWEDVLAQSLRGHFRYLVSPQILNLYSYLTSDSLQLREIKFCKKMHPLCRHSLLVSLTWVVYWIPKFSDGRTLPFCALKFLFHTIWTLEPVFNPLFSFFFFLFFIILTSEFLDFPSARCSKIFFDWRHIVSNHLKWPF